MDWTGDEKAADMASMEQAESVVAQPALWTIPQVSEAMQVSRAKIYQLIAQEGLPVIRFGRTVRVSPIELQQWIKQRGML